MMKQLTLVMTVTMIAIASLPPAFRVHTEADAKVQGVAAATRSPMAKFSPKAPCRKLACCQTDNGSPHRQR